MIKSIKFLTKNNVSYDTWDAFSLITSKVTIGSPKPKKILVDVPCADGSLDLTEALGEVRFSNRTITIAFTYMGTDWPWDYSQLQNTINGQKVKVFCEEDRNTYYYGRCNVSDRVTENGISTVTVEIDAEPWKYKKDITENVKTISGTQEVTYFNLRKSVVPEIEVTGEMTMLYKGKTYKLSKGKHKFDDIVFVEGNNEITWTGNGTVTVRYQEGSL